MKNDHRENKSNKDYEMINVVKNKIIYIRSKKKACGMLKIA